MQKPRTSTLCLLLDLRAKAGLLFLKLGSELGAEVRRLEQRANLDLSFLSRWIRTTSYPLDRLFQRSYLPEPESRDQLLCFGEWSVDDRGLLPGEPDARAFGARLKPLARQHDPRLHQFFVKIAHIRE